MNTNIINKWWDSLTHEQKFNYIKNMDPYNWGRPISVSSISKNQKSELYQQIHDPEHLKRIKNQKNIFGVW